MCRMKNMDDLIFSLSFHWVSRRVHGWGSWCGSVGLMKRKETQGKGLEKFPANYNYHPLSDIILCVPFLLACQLSSPTLECEAAVMSRILASFARIIDAKSSRKSDDRTLLHYSWRMCMGAAAGSGLQGSMLMLWMSWIMFIGSPNGAIYVSF